MPLRARYILGIVGRRFSGRSALLHHLELDKGFAVYNLEDVLAERLFLAHTVRPAGDPLRKIAVETRREEQSSGVIGNWAAQSIRRDHLMRTDSWQPPPKIAVAGFERLEELAAFSSFSRFAVLTLLPEDSVRKDRAIASGWLAEEHPGVQLRSASLPRFRELVDSVEVEPRNQDFAEDMNPLMETAEKLSCPRLAIRLSWAGYRARGLASFYDQLDGFVGQLDYRFAAGDF